MQVYDRQRVNKTGAENHAMQVGNKTSFKTTQYKCTTCKRETSPRRENHGKAGDARRKTGSRGPAACMGVKACIGGNKMQKAMAKTKSALKTEFSQL